MSRVRVLNCNDQEQLMSTMIKKEVSKDEGMKLPFRKLLNELTSTPCLPFRLAVTSLSAR